MIDRILCSPFSCPATVNIMPYDRKANDLDRFCLPIADLRVYKYRVEEAAVENHHAS